MARTASAPTPIPQPSRVLLTPRQLASWQPGLTLGAVRWDLFNRDKNGLAASGAVLHRGRNLLIDPERYLSWMEGNREG
jgi:hypothetical protein